MTQRRRKAAYNQNMLTRPVPPLFMPAPRTIHPQHSRLRACAQKAFGWGHSDEPEALQPFSWLLVFRLALNSATLPSWQGFLGTAGTSPFVQGATPWLAALWDRLSDRADGPDPCPASPHVPNGFHEHIAYLITTFPHTFQIVR